MVQETNQEEPMKWYQNIRWMWLLGFILLLLMIVVMLYWAGVQVGMLLLLWIFG